MKKILVIVFFLISYFGFSFSTFGEKQNQTKQKLLSGKAWQSQISDGNSLSENHFLLIFKGDGTIVQRSFKFVNTEKVIETELSFGTYKESTDELKITINIPICPEGKAIYGKYQSETKTYKIKWINDSEVELVGIGNKSLNFAEFLTREDKYTKDNTPRIVEMLIKYGITIEPSELEVMAIPFRTVKGKAYKLTPLNEGIVSDICIFFEDGTYAQKIRYDNNSSKLKVGFYKKTDDEIIFSRKNVFLRKSDSSTWVFEWVNSQEFNIYQGKQALHYVLDKAI